MPAWLYYSRPINVAFHNLCNSSFILPNGIKQILGLGLNFCPRPNVSTKHTAVQTSRFYRDCCTRMFFGNTIKTNQESGLFARSNWAPDINEIPSEFRARISYFIQKINYMFKKTVKAQTNFLPTQLHAFNWLRHNQHVIVFPTDKNLGPAIMERKEYINIALTEHLSDESTYRQLDENIAQRRIKTIQIIIKQIIESLKIAGRKNDAKYLLRTSEVEDPYPYFYLLAKVHKIPFKTRPIISTSGSILYGLGKWVDYVLQHICKDLPYRTKSSVSFVEDLKKIKQLPLTAKFFTCDATSMYTNINTTHALALIEEYLKQKPNILDSIGIPLHIFIKGLQTVMIHNVFKFGDTFWIQNIGTAMGAPPAPMYATLYFSILEQKIIPTFPNCYFYNRFIDDGFGIWIETPTDDLVQNDNNWTLFQQKFNEVSTLKWTFSSLVRTIEFLDLTCTIEDDGFISTKVYEKALNLHLYLPPHSCHPPGMIKGLIHGMMIRFFRLSSSEIQAKIDIKKLLERLVARGYSSKTLNEVMSAAYRNIVCKPQESLNKNQKQDLDQIYLHLPYHPSDPKSSDIQHIYRLTIKNPPGEVPISLLRTKNGSYFGCPRMILAYSKPLSIGNYLSPRKLAPPGLVPSEMIKKFEVE